MWDFLTDLVPTGSGSLFLSVCSAIFNEDKKFLYRPMKSTSDWKIMRAQDFVLSIWDHGTEGVQDQIVTNRSESKLIKSDRSEIGNTAF